MARRSRERRWRSPPRPRRLAVDHDHQTGVVRQLLCHRCNLVTRAVEEDPALLDAIRHYLGQHGS
ncbi:endonuclease domain-containing protein [Catenuloplanes sp. NPDC051500]|uniref:endonuclease domain-containing protein n=1 Tax=Catenuloplanes sp. NPDC051500 TaxID=3363959 RepID=UPI0037AE37BD